MATNDTARLKPMIPTSAMIAIPLGVAALTYVGDTVLPGGGDVQLGRGFAVLRYAAIAAAFAILQAFFVVPMLLRRSRYVLAATMLIYLLVLAAVLLWLGSVETR